MYRPFRVNHVSTVTFQGAPVVVSDEFTVLTWELPVLAKYRFASIGRGLQPMLETGPAFRLSGNLNGYAPSKIGFTAGAGVEKRFGWVTILPALRYTRWTDDRKQLQQTRPNQVELLVSTLF